MSGFAIETEGLTRVFHNRWAKTELRAVDNVSLRVPEGCTFGLLGANGAGKTTFVKMLLSSVHPTAGAARIFGLDSHDPTARRSVGYLPENHRFPTYMTGWGMLDFYGALSGMDAAARRRKIPEMLTVVGLDERAWHTRLGKYSKGMLQRVGLGQAMIHAPRLLILDEPSDGVDPVGRKQIRDVLQGLEQQGVTIFLNSHLLAEVELFCREVAIIQKGKLSLTGSVRDLTSGSGYRVTAVDVPELLHSELVANAKAHSAVDGTLELLYNTRQQANQALDSLRANQIELESLAPTRSTLEEVFIRTISEPQPQQGTLKP